MMSALTGPRIIRKAEWTDWQRSPMLERQTLACMETALEQSVLTWTQALAQHQEALQSAQQASLQETAVLRQQAQDQGRQEGLDQWLEHLLVWTHYRRTRLASLRDDMAAVLCSVLSQVLTSVPTGQWLTDVLNQLDPLIDGQHTLMIHVAAQDHAAAVAAVEGWWRTSGWYGTAPQVLGSEALQAGQCRMVSAAGEVEVDMPALLVAFERCVWPRESADDANTPSSKP